MSYQRCLDALTGGSLPAWSQISLTGLPSAAQGNLRDGPSDRTLVRTAQPHTFEFESEVWTFMLRMTRQSARALGLTLLLGLVVTLSACSDTDEPAPVPTSEPASEEVKEKAAQEFSEEVVEQTPRARSAPDFLQALWNSFSSSEKEYMCSLVNGNARQTYLGMIDSLEGPAGARVAESEVPTFDEFSDFYGVRC